MGVVFLSGVVGLGCMALYASLEGLLCPSAGWKADVCCMHVCGMLGGRTARTPHACGCVPRPCRMPLCSRYSHDPPWTAPLGDAEGPCGSWWRRRPPPSGHIPGRAACRPGTARCGGGGGCEAGGAASRPHGGRAHQPVGAVASKAARHCEWHCCCSAARRDRPAEQPGTGRWCSNSSLVRRRRRRRQPRRPAAAAAARTAACGCGRRGRGSIAQHLQRLDRAPAEDGGGRPGQPTGHTPAGPSPQAGCLSPGRLGLPGRFERDQQQQRQPFGLLLGSRQWQQWRASAAAAVSGHCGPGLCWGRCASV